MLGRASAISRTLPRRGRQTAQAPIHSALSSANDVRLDVWMRDRMSGIQVTHDVLDCLRVTQLHRTLPTRQPEARIRITDDMRLAFNWPETCEGDALPDGNQLAFFQPKDWLGHLAPDGASTEFNAPQPYTMRMWAGGLMQWRPNSAKRLTVGSTVTQVLRVERVEIKKNMVFVYQRRDLYPGMLDPDDTAALDPDGWTMSEIRSHVFRQPQAVSAGLKKTKAALIASPDPSTWPYRMSYTPSSPLLFRFSALTFNGHKIHYDREWTREKEGHPDLVVHGPLNAVLLVELASFIASRKGKRLLSFDYRATSPMYVDKEIRLLARPDEAQGAEWNRLVLEAQQGDRVGMMATAILGA